MLTLYLPRERSKSLFFADDSLSAFNNLADFGTLVYLKSRLRQRLETFLGEMFRIL